MFQKSIKKTFESQSKTKEEAIANIQEAIELYLEILREEGRPVPEAEQNYLSGNFKRSLVADLMAELDG